MSGRAVVVLASALALAACCGPQVGLLRDDRRGKLDECTRFVVLATVLEGPSAGVAPASTTSTSAAPSEVDARTGLVPDDLGDQPWVYVTPCWPGVLSSEVEEAWRPPTTRGGQVADGEGGAPEPIRSALQAARAVLEARGLLPLERDAPREARVLVLGVSVSTVEVGLDEVGTVAEGAVRRLRLARVAVHAGSVLDGKFVRDLTSIAAVYPVDCAPDEPFEDEVVRTVTRLVKAMPD